MENPVYGFSSVVLIYKACLYKSEECSRIVLHFLSLNQSFCFWFMICFNELNEPINID